MGPGAGKKHKKKNKNQGGKNEKVEEPKLTLTIETLNFFDNVKIPPPSYAKDIDETITKLVQKKEYFNKASEEAAEKGDNKQEETEKKEETKDEEKNKEEEKPKQKKSQINFFFFQIFANWSI